MSNLSPHPPSHAGRTPFLDDFFPYRLAVLADGVSRAVAEVYSGRYDLTRGQWRVLAALGNLPSGEKGGLSAKALTGQTMLDKVQVSRAVSGLAAARLVTGRTNSRDKRSKTLALTATGRALFDEIAPLVRAREDSLLSVLDRQHRDTLLSAMRALDDRARQLQRDNGLSSPN